MQMIRKTAVVLAMVAFATAASGACYTYDVPGGTATLGSSTQINSTDRFLIHQGTVILNEGASIICGGDYEGVCNFLGVDRNNMAAALIVNGGTFWCSSSKGKGCLKISANNNNQEATLTINSGSVTVDDCILTCTYWNSNNGSTGRGIINVNGGALTVGTLWLGANTDSTGSTEVYLAGGELAAKSIGFLSGNQQIFKFQGGTVKARQANVFSVGAYSGAKGRTIEAVADTVSTFDNSGFNQTLPPLTGTGTLRLTGTGTFSFSEKVLSYGLDLAGTAVSLGTASADIPCLELGGKLAVSGPTVVNVTLPEGASGRFPIFANCGAANAADVSANLLHPQGTFMLDGTTVYLDTTVSRVLIYSDAAGGDDTPAYSTYPYARFLESAGAFTVNGDGPLTLTDSSTVLSVESAVTQTINRALTFLSPSAAIDTVADSTLVLKGAFTATAPVKKGPGTLVLDPASDWTIAGFYAEEGTVDLAGRTCTGMFWLTGNGAGRTVTFRNGTWLYGEPEGYQKGRLDFLGYDVHFGAGFNLTFTNTTGRMAVGWDTATTPRAETQVFLDPGCGTVTLRGNTSDCCNFIGVDKAATSRVFVNGGTLHVTSDNAGGTLRIAAGANASSTVGQLTVAGGELKVDNDLTLATLFDRMNGGKGTAEFNLESGVARIGNLHLGASSSNTGKGTIRLTGGDLHVMMLKCWGYCAQTLLCDGATIHAVQDSNTSQPFLTALAGADGYTRTYAIGANGLTLDTAGFATVADLPFAGTGTLTVTGEGSLTYTATAPLAANVAVSSGATLALANRRTLSETVSLAPDATLKVAAVETEPLVFTNAITLAAGAKIEVDVSGIESAQTSLSAADFILPAESNILDFVTLKDREDVPRYVTSVDPDGDGRTVRIMLADRTTPCFAVWTGRGDPANAHDTDNWECRNVLEEIVPDVLPMNLTVVRLNGLVAFSVPADHPLTIKEFAFGGPVTLSGDCDWRGFGTVEIPEGAVIDLHGHKLYLSDLTGAGTITDTSVEYVPLEYIESTGGQWIDTGHTHTADTRIDCVISASAKQPQNFAAVFGAFNGSAAKNAFAFCALYDRTSGDCPELTRSGKQQTGSGFFYDEKVNVSCVGGRAEWNKVADPSQTGSILNSSGTVDAGTCTLAIFNIHNGTGVQSNAGALMKLYSFQIREGEELKCNFVPMRRVSDGASGLLDLMDGVFHPSQTGNFIGVEPANSTVTYGELHLDVAPLRTLDIATVTLSGVLKVVKDGAGTLTYTKAGLSYCGGTHVASGTFKLSQTGSNIASPGTEVIIDAGATFDFNGMYDAHTYEYVLNGGTIANTGADVSSTKCCLRHLRLTADSTMDVPKRFGFVGTAFSQTRLDLAGHTLTVMADWDFYLSNVEMTAGTFKMTGGFLRIAEGDIRASETDFDLDCVLTHMTNGDVRNFTYRKDATKTQSGTYLAYNTGKMRVHGVFTPVTDYFHNVEMQNGSTLDLSGRTGPWSLLSLNGENGNATNKKGTHLVTFVGNATIYIKLGRRHLGRNEKLLGWDASSKPANLDTLTFEQAPDSRRGGGFYIGTDGLYFRSGFAIFVR